MKPTALVAMNTRSRNTLIRRARVQRRTGTGRARRGQFVLCVRTDGYDVSLEARKIYVALPDPDAAAHGQLRVVDESGEDYLFPSELFVPIEVRGTLRRALLAAV